MPGIFDDARRGSGPIAPDPSGAGHISAGAASRTAHGAPTPPPAPNPGGNSLPPNVSIIPFQTLSGVLDQRVEGLERPAAGCLIVQQTLGHVVGQVDAVDLVGETVAVEFGGQVALAHGPLG